MQASIEFARSEYTHDVLYLPFSPSKEIKRSDFVILFAHVPLHLHWKFTIEQQWHEAPSVVDNKFIVC